MRFYIVLIAICSCGALGQFSLPSGLSIPSPNEIFHKMKPMLGQVHSDNSENGNWNFFGRDILRHLLHVVKDAKENINLFSNRSSGLDTIFPSFPGRQILSDAIGNFKRNLKLIVPGTQWCGDGSKAKSSDDLGLFKTVDACCRDHDNCNDTIEAFSSNYGLENTGLFTRSHCSCDLEFYNCLADTNNFIANKIGFTFFDVLGPQCFEENYPIISCKNIHKGKCEEYEFDTTEPKKYQWFDNKNY